jgi:aliphatic nitrilase
MGDDFHTVRLAAVQAAPVFLDREATVDKACRLIHEAGNEGADIIAFSEGFIPAHPLWFHFQPSTSPTARRLSRELFKNAVSIPSRETQLLCSAARDASAYVVMGLCEKEQDSMGSMFNSQLFISPAGEIIGVRRKIMPTGAERIVHTAGSGDSVRIFEGSFGGLSGLMCGENSNPLLTFAMQALNARIHVAAWPSFFNPSTNMQRIADVASRAIAYQNSCFVISVCGAVSESMADAFALTDEDRAYMREAAERGGTSIYAPGGEVIAGPLSGGEDILYADAELERIIPAKIVHDYSGDYNRFDIFQLLVNRSPQQQNIRLDSPTVRNPSLDERDGPRLILGADVATQAPDGVGDDASVREED